MTIRWLFVTTILFTLCVCVPVMAQLDTSVGDYFGTLVSAGAETIAWEVNLTENVYCKATWLTPEYYIARKMREVIGEDVSSKEANDILEKMFKEEIPNDLVEIVVTFRCTPDGPEYTLPGNIASGAVLYNDQGVRVEGELKEKLIDDLTLRPDWEYRSMLLDFKRYLTRGKDKKKVDILADAKTITLDLPYVTKAGKPISFTWIVPPKYPPRPREMAKLIDFAHDKFKIVW
ncbi:MAG: hypothetical protein ABIH23_07270 [bacterium]